MLPIFIQCNQHFKNADQCAVYSEDGTQLDLAEAGISITFRTPVSALVTGPDWSVTFSQKFWEDTIKRGSDFFVKIGKNEDGKIWAGGRKFYLDNDETEVDIESINVETTQLRNIVFDPRLFIPIMTGKYLDNYWSRKGGILPATNIMITGDPGIGKSSNLMDVLVGIKIQDMSKRVLYISAEMSAIDLEEFLQFYPGLENIDFLFLGDYLTDPNQKIKPYQALQSVLDQGWDVVVIDSLYETQSMIQEDLDISSFKKGERYMLDLMNKHNGGHNKLNLFTAFLAIQQKNKSGQYVGSKRLEHMTTGFLQLLWDPKERGKRYMIFEKNRKGKEKVKLYYSLTPDKGITYDETRHEKELAFMELLQQNAGMSLEELGEVDFDKIFAKREEELVANN